jgi:hypothetical protein
MILGNACMMATGIPTPPVCLQVRDSAGVAKVVWVHWQPRLLACAGAR